MALEVSARLHVTSGELERSVALPPLPGGMQHSPSFLDRLGEAVAALAPVVGLGALGGALLGSLLARRGGTGAFGALLGGVTGALTGSAITTGALAAVRGDRAHDPAAPAPGAAAPATEVRRREDVRVMTWNIHGGMGGSGYGASRAELDALAAAVREQDPDVLVLQEVDRFATRSNWTDVMQELDERLNPDSAVAGSASTTVAGRNQDVAVMTFNGFDVTNARNIVHPDPRGGGLGTRARAFAADARRAVGSLLGRDWSQPQHRYQVRNTLEAMVRTPGGTDVRVLTGHYEWENPQFDHPRLQVGALAGVVGAWQGPTIWGGDFNVHSERPLGERERGYMADAGLTDAFEAVGMAADDRRRVTSPSGARIDRIYTSRHSVVRDVETLEAGWASDHKAVVADLELVPGSARTR